MKDHLTFQKISYSVRAAIYFTNLMRFSLSLLWLSRYSTNLVPMTCTTSLRVARASSSAPSRAESMEFSDPYCDAYQYIVVKEDDDKVKTIDDLAGYIIGVHLGTTGDFLASDEVNMGVLAGTGASVQQYKDLTIAAMGLKAGDVQAIVCDKLLAENLCTINDGLKCFEATYADGSSTLEQYAVAAAKGQTSLIEKVNEIISPLKEDGTIDQYILDESAKASALNEEAESETETEAASEAAETETAAE